MLLSSFISLQFYPPLNDLFFTEWLRSTTRTFESFLRQHMQKHSNFFYSLLKKVNWIVCKTSVNLTNLRELQSHFASLFIVSICFVVKVSSVYEADNRALLLLLKGGCLHQMNSPLQAEECLTGVLALERRLKEDHYLVPYALVQLGIIHYQQGAFQKAVQILDDAKQVDINLKKMFKLTLKYVWMNSDFIIKKPNNIYWFQT